LFSFLSFNKKYKNIKIFLFQDARSPSVAIDVEDIGRHGSEGSISEAGDDEFDAEHSDAEWNASEDEEKG
jgi:hypothetical protein